jgi:hypothetical protein
MRGSNGEVVDVNRYTDKLDYDRRVYRLSRHGAFVGEYKTPEELGKVVDLAQLVEDEDHTSAEGDTGPPSTSCSTVSRAQRAAGSSTSRSARSSGPRQVSGAAGGACRDVAGGTDLIKAVG